MSRKIRNVLHYITMHKLKDTSSPCIKMILAHFLFEQKSSHFSYSLDERVETNRN